MEWEMEGRIRAEGERRGREEVESGEHLHMIFQHSVSCDINPINPLSATFVSDHQSPAKNPPFG